ncbi:hypothetical protein ANCCAN_22428 [Ancylostoma caninum]|uniref:Uncharacterized protein n=1 Tax=Ancylostoma caninum TaxID=29170 RepID=A0A368FLQ4_ANCCA|nr:hypothetical protein ANCCAN_22428 [Ancylostoma caninum]
MQWQWQFVWQCLLFFSITRNIHIVDGGNVRMRPLQSRKDLYRCIERCIVYLEHVESSVHLSFLHDNANSINLRRDMNNRFEFFYDSCRQPMDDVECRSRSLDKPSICICNGSRRRCNYDSADLLTSENW